MQPDKAMHLAFVMPGRPRGARVITVARGPYVRRRRACGQVRHGHLFARDSQCVALVCRPMAEEQRAQLRLPISLEAAKDVRCAFPPFSRLLLRTYIITCAGPTFQAQLCLPPVVTSHFHAQSIVYKHVPLAALPTQSRRNSDATQTYNHDRSLKQLRFQP